MENIKCTVKANVLTIEVKLDVKGTESKSGKSMVLASTKGNVDVPGAAGVKFGLNIYKKK